MIDRAGLARGSIRPRASPGQSDIVLQQSLRPGTRVALKTPIDIVISQIAETVVPNLIARTEREAREVIARSRLSLGKTTREASPRTTGEVIAQSLKAGARVAAGSVIDITVADTDLVTVPRLIGLDEAQANIAIDRSRLSRGQPSRRPSPGPGGVVLQQTPEAGRRVAAGTAVAIVISQTEQVTVPDLVGRPLREAQVIIRDRRLAIGQITTRFSDKPENEVLEQSVRSGSRVPVGTEIGLTVVEVELVSVPVVIGLSFEDAVRVITGARLSRGNINREESPAAVDSVIKQSREPGARVPAGEPIDLVLAMPQTTTVPSIVGLSMEEAFRRIAAARLFPGSLEREKGARAVEEVLRQTPKAGERVAVGSEVGLVIAIVNAQDASTSPLVRIPNLVGRSDKEAAVLLAAAGLRQGATQEQASQRPFGEVLSQSPLAGTEVAVATPVELVVAARAQAQWSVPDVVGRSRTEAEALIASAGLSVGSITERWYFLRPAGTIVEQTPAAAALLPAPASVNLIVSTGFPAWAAVALGLAVGVGFLIYRGIKVPPDRASRPQTPPAAVSVRTQSDGGYQEVRAAGKFLELEIRVRSTVDRGIQSIRDGS
jgi:beta-lactam-binding protein with PASTA domain